jgi:hypothetical protein
VRSATESLNEQVVLPFMHEDQAVGWHGTQFGVAAKQTAERGRQIGGDAHRKAGP